MNEPLRAWIKVPPEVMNRAARRLAQAALGHDEWSELEKIWDDVPEARDPWIRAARGCGSELVAELFRAERLRRRNDLNRVDNVCRSLTLRNMDLEYDALELMDALDRTLRALRWARINGQMSDKAEKRIAGRIKRALKEHSIKPEEERKAVLGVLSAQTDWMAP